MQSSLSRIRRLQNQRGQGMTEYVIIVGVIAILLIIVAYNYGGSIKAMFDSANTELTNTSDTVSGSASGVSSY